MTFVFVCWHLCWSRKSSLVSFSNPLASGSTKVRRGPCLVVTSYMWRTFTFAVSMAIKGFFGHKRYIRLFCTKGIPHACWWHKCTMQGKKKPPKNQLLRTTVWVWPDLGYPNSGQTKTVGQRCWKKWFSGVFFCKVFVLFFAHSPCNFKYLTKTSQELRMLSNVTLNCQVTKIVIYSDFQLSEL